MDVCLHSSSSFLRRHKALISESSLLLHNICQEEKLGFPTVRDLGAYLLVLSKCSRQEGSPYHVILAQLYCWHKQLFPFGLSARMCSQKAKKYWQHHRSSMARLGCHPYLACDCQLITNLSFVKMKYKDKYKTLTSVYAFYPSNNSLLQTWRKNEKWRNVVFVVFSSLCQLDMLNNNLAKSAKSSILCRLSLEKRMPTSP